MRTLLCPVVTNVLKSTLLNFAVLTQSGVWGFQFSKFKLMLVLVLVDQTLLWF